MIHPELINQDNPKAAELLNLLKHSEKELSASTLRIMAHNGLQRYYTKKADAWQLDTPLLYSTACITYATASAMKEVFALVRAFTMDLTKDKKTALWVWVTQDVTNPIDRHMGLVRKFHIAIPAQSGTTVSKAYVDALNYFAKLATEKAIKIEEAPILQEPNPQLAIADALQNPKLAMRLIGDVDLYTQSVLATPDTTIVYNTNHRRKGLFAAFNKPASYVSSNPIHFDVDTALAVLSLLKDINPTNTTVFETFTEKGISFTILAEAESYKRLLANPNFTSALIMGRTYLNSELS